MIVYSCGLVKQVFSVGLGAKCILLAEAGISNVACSHSPLIDLRPKGTALCHCWLSARKLCRLSKNDHCY